MGRKRDYRSHSERYGYDYVNVRQIVPYRLPRTEIEPLAVPVAPEAAPPDLPITREFPVSGKGSEPIDVYLRAGQLSVKARYEVRVFERDRNALIGSGLAGRGQFVLLDRPIRKPGWYRLKALYPNGSWRAVVRQHPL